MLLIGCDYHPSMQQIAMLDTETGDYSEHRWKHSDGEAEKFYRDLKVHTPEIRRGPRSHRTQTMVRTIINRARLRAMGWGCRPNCNDACPEAEDGSATLPAIAEADVEDRFRRRVDSSLEDRDLQQLLWHRHRTVQMRTRILNQLQSIAMNKGIQRRGGLRSVHGRKRLEQNPRDEHPGQAI